MAAAFFSRLNFSFGNEDPATEKRALFDTNTSKSSSKRVLCVTASGDRPLNLLSNNCDEIVAIDANPLQNHLLHLKMAALEKLNYPEYLEFLGALPSKQARSSKLHILLDDMDPAAARYWMGQTRAIDAGILYQGVVERLTSKLAFLAHVVRPRKVKQLFSFKNLDEQRRFVREEWDTPFLRKTVSVLMHPRFSNFYYQDPGLQGMNLSKSFNIGQFFYQRMTDCLQRHLASESSLSSLLLRGFVSPEAFSPYLREEGHATIQNRLGRIKVRTDDLIGYLEKAPEQSFDVFSLSDVASYISPENFNRLLQAVYRTAKPEARFCIRQFMSSQQIPKHLQSHFQRDEHLELELEKEDRCFVYRFMVGNICK